MPQPPVTGGIVDDGKTLYQQAVNASEPLLANFFRMGRGAAVGLSFRTPAETAAVRQVP